MRVTNLSRTLSFAPLHPLTATLFSVAAGFCCLDPLLKKYNPTRRPVEYTCRGIYHIHVCFGAPDCPVVLRPEIYLRAVQMQIVPNVAQVSSNLLAPRGEDSGRDFRGRVPKMKWFQKCDVLPKKYIS